MDNILNASRIKINGIYTDDHKLYPKGRYEVPTAEKDIEYIDIRGRHGSLTKKYGYKDIPFLVTFFIHAEPFKTAFRKAKPFLLGAKTIQVDDDDEIFHKVKSVKVNPAENLMKTFGEFEVEFILDPFQYELSNEPRTITARTVITNEGYESEPIMTVHCTGTGKVYVNDVPITIKDINGTITIDSEMMNAYRKGTSITNLNNHMVGDFPVLRHGSNTISFDGDIGKIELIKNWRWV